MEKPENAICIGGILDRQIVKIANPGQHATDYTLHDIRNGFDIVLYYYLHKDLTVSQAFHRVFASYGKKAK